MIPGKENQGASDDIPPDLLETLEDHREAKKIFEKLPPSHKREYVNWINEAKKSETQIGRIE